MQLGSKHHEATPGLSMHGSNPCQQDGSKALNNIGSVKMFYHYLTGDNKVVYELIVYKVNCGETMKNG
jgi:hypothetical protein